MGLLDNSVEVIVRAG